MRFGTLFCGSLGLIAMALPVEPAVAAVATSNDFSIGLGYRGVNGSVFVWDTLETADANTAVTGDFTLTYSATSTHYSGRGPTFSGRNIANGTDGALSGNSATFLLTITATYTGAAAAGGVSLQLDNLSIYGFAYSPARGDDLQMSFEETTPGQSAVSNPITLASGTGGTSLTLASNYRKLGWDPADFEVAGTSVTRTFVVSSDAARPLDGLEFAGRIIAIPEPASLALLGAGVLAMVRRHRGGEISR